MTHSDEHSSLLCLGVNYDGKKFFETGSYKSSGYNIKILSRMVLPVLKSSYKLFYTCKWCHDIQHKGARHNGTRRTNKNETQHNSERRFRDKTHNIFHESGF